jgi:hypothetical protein
MSMIGARRLASSLGSFGLVLACAASCSSRPSSTSAAPLALPSSVAGVVQKGPFIRGSSVVVQSLDANLAPTGQTFEAVTSDDLGSFSIPVHVTSRYIEVVATGYYFDELTGSLSAAPLTLRALADLGGSPTVDVNLLTSAAEPLVRALVLPASRSRRRRRKPRPASSRRAGSGRGSGSRSRRSTSRRAARRARRCSRPRSSSSSTRSRSERPRSRI